jgi:scyllo-inositol 2-dehydrogenase (NADP+)
MEPFKWGIIGPGNIARDFAKDLQHATQKQKVTAVLSRTLDHAKEFAAEFCAPFYTDNLSRFLTEADVDAVYIATPHAQHYQYTMACLEHQIPVLCEKPLAINQQQVKDMIATASANRTFLMEAMWIRFLPSIQHVITNLYLLGPITSIKADLSFRAPHDKEHKRFFDPALGGGSLLDLGVYPIFLSFLILGKPCSIKAVARLSMAGVDEACAAVLKYAGSQYAMVESSLIDQTESNAIIYGERGYIKICQPWNEKPERIQMKLYDGTETDLPVKWEGRGMHFEADEVVRCIRNGKLESSVLNLQTSLDVTEIMDEIRSQVHIHYKADAMAV